MSFDKAKDVLQTAGITIDALSMIQDLTKVSGDKAEDALAIIAVIVETLQDGLAGKTTPDVVEAELKAVMSRVTVSERVLDDKFDPGD